MEIKKFCEFILESEDIQIGQKKRNLSDIVKKLKEERIRQGIPDGYYKDDSGKFKPLSDLHKDEEEDEGILPEDYYDKSNKEIKEIQKYFRSKYKEEEEEFKKATFTDDYINEIREISSLFDKVITEVDPIENLKKRLKYLESPISDSELNKIEEMQFNLMTSYLVKEFIRSSEEIRTTLKGYNFESFISGLMKDCNPLTNDQDPIDLKNKNGSVTMQLKFYETDSIHLSKKGELLSNEILNYITTPQEENNSEIDNLKERLENLKNEKLSLLKCTDYIIALKYDNDIKIFFITKEIMENQFKAKFYSDAADVLEKYRPKKYIKLIKEYRINSTNGSFLIGNGLVISKSSLNKSEIEFINFNIPKLKSNENKMDMYFKKYVEEFQKKSTELDLSYKKMIFGKNSNDVARNYRKNYESTNKALENIKEHVINSSYQNIKKDSQKLDYYGRIIP
jgi:hypothetical protein